MPEQPSPPSIGGPITFTFPVIPVRRIDDQTTHRFPRSVSSIGLLSQTLPSDLPLLLANLDSHKMTSRPLDIPGQLLNVSPSSSPAGCEFTSSGFLSISVTYFRIAS